MLLAIHEALQTSNAENKKISDFQEHINRSIASLEKQQQGLMCVLAESEQQSAVSDSCLESPARLRYRSASDAVRVNDITPQKLCTKKCCNCSCHMHYGFRSPHLFDGLFGSVSLTYSDILLTCSRCKAKKCPTRSTSNFRATVTLPVWLQVFNAFIITANFYQYPELCLRISSIRPKSDSIFRFAIDGKEDMIKALFTSKEASVFDVDEDGDSALHVSFLCLARKGSILKRLKACYLVAST